jgi:asparagine synthase (glutamine-hydrolysing)
MAPDSNSFVQADSPEYVEEMLSESKIAEYGIFQPEYVSRMKEKCRRLSHAHMSFKDNMSFIGILSTQLLIDHYIENFKAVSPLKRESYKVWQDQSQASPDAAKMIDS